MKSDLILPYGEFGKWSEPLCALLGVICLFVFSMSSDPGEENTYEGKISCLLLPRQFYVGRVTRWIQMGCGLCIGIEGPLESVPWFRHVLGTGSS